MKMKDDSDIKGIKDVKFCFHFDQDSKTYSEFKNFLTVAFNNNENVGMVKSIKEDCKTFWCVWFFLLVFVSLM